MAIAYRYIRDIPKLTQSINHFSKKESLNVSLKNWGCSQAVLEGPSASINFWAAEPESQLKGLKIQSFMLYLVSYLHLSQKFTFFKRANKKSPLNVAKFLDCSSKTRFRVEGMELPTLSSTPQFFLNFVIYYLTWLHKIRNSKYSKDLSIILINYN